MREKGQGGELGSGVQAACRSNWLTIFATGACTGSWLLRSQYEAFRTVSRP